MEVLDRAITGEDMWDSLTKVDASKAAGPVGIHPAIGKPLAEVLVEPCVQLFIASPDKERLPADCLTSTAIPVHKGSDRDNCDNYGPGSLPSIMIKTLERILRDRIMNHLEANK